jgi:hypothetical protein
MSPGCGRIWVIDKEGSGGVWERWGHSPRKLGAHPPEGQGDDQGNGTANLVALLVNDYLG